MCGGKRKVNDMEKSVHKLIEKRKALIHFIANCTVCDWQTQDYMAGQKESAKHASKTGHRVIAELGYTCSYGGE